MMLRETTFAIAKFEWLKPFEKQKCNIAIALL